MYYWIAFIAFVIAALQIKDLSLRNFAMRPWLLFSLSIIGLLLAFVKQCSDDKKLKYSGDVGILDGSVKRKVIHPKLQFGESSITFGGKGSMFGNLDLDVRLEDHKLLVDTKIRNSSGILLVEIIRNEWKTGKTAWDKNFNDRALEVKDEKGRIVFQAIYDKEKVIIHGLFYREDGFGVCFSPESKGAMELMMQPGMESRTVNSIKPYFRYPSEYHPGELATD